MPGLWQQTNSESRSMKIAMLGWEYPPHISGGLGTACEGLSIALSRHQVKLTFVVPHLYGDERAHHMRLVNAQGDSGNISGQTGSPRKIRKGDFEKLSIPSFLMPYHNAQSYRAWVKMVQQQRAKRALIGASEGGHEVLLPSHITSQFDNIPHSNDLDTEMDECSVQPFDRYCGDIFAEVARYATSVVEALKEEEFDVIHAHDWLTFPAGVALAQVTGKPFIAHVHSLEYDRSGEAINHQINEIEKWGLEAASSVVAVSYYTRSLINQRLGIPLDKISVIHNGVYSPQAIQSYRKSQNVRSRIVLFLGRITFQKGPDYFVEAAGRVIPHVPDVMFVMAGAGDMLPQLQNRIRALGIEKNFYFPGFLKGQEVEQMFSLADVYVMPSVSEPFGISALEAISYDTPVIISRQSGVSEVLSHALKVDFWDIDRLSDLIINALVHEELRSDMVSMAREEVKRLHWDAAAQKTIDLYRQVVGRGAAALGD